MTEVRYTEVRYYVAKPKIAISSMVAGHEAQ